MLKPKIIQLLRGYGLALIFVCVTQALGSIIPLTLPGQEFLHADYHLFSNSAFTAPTDNQFNVTFENGFTANATFYQSFPSLIQISMLTNTQFQYFHIYQVSNSPDKVLVHIHIQGTNFAKIGFNLLTLDLQSPFYSSIATFDKSLNNDVNSSIPYVEDFAFPIPLTNFPSSSLKMIPMLTKIKMHTYTPAYCVDYNPIFMVVNHTHYQVTIFPGISFFIFDIKVYLLVIQTNIIQATTYNRFAYFDMDQNTNSIYQYQDQFLMNKENILMGITEFDMCNNGPITNYWTNFQIDYVSQSSVYLNGATLDTFTVTGVLFYQIVCPNNMQFAPNNQTCDCYNNTWSINNVCTDVIGCISVRFINLIVTCTFCDISKRYQLIGGHCFCQSGFNSTYLENSTCIQICGDGINIQSQCDDGNTISGDGCSSTCTLQPNANCAKDAFGKSICKVIEDIQLNLVSIMKVDNQNQAVLTFEAVNTVFPFSLNFLKSDISITDIKNVQVYSVSSQGHELLVTISYTKTIQGQGATFTFDFSNTQYTSINSVINLQTIGQNQPLVCSDFLEAIKKITSGSSTVGVLGLVILILALPAPKYIGVQTVQTIQLFYFSLLLTNPIQIWPPAYKALTPLKYSNGYSLSIISQNIQFSSNFSKKFNFLGLNYLFLNNNNIMIGLLFIMSLSYFVISFIKYNAEKSLIQKYKIFKEKEEKQMLQKFVWMSGLIENCFKICFHFSMFLFLQVSASIFIQSATLNNLSNIFTNQQMALSTILMILTFAIILMFFMTNFKNLILPSVQIKKLKTRYEKLELIHVKLNIIYLYIISILMMACNSLQLLGIPFSVFVLLYQLFYIIILIKVNPYKHSLRLHRFALIFNNASFLLFLCLLSFNNYFKPEQIYQICLCYYILGVSAIIFTLSIVRLYYQYRYGNQLDEKIRKEDQKLQQVKQKAKKSKNLINLAKQNLQLKEKIQKYEKQAKIREQNNHPIDLLYSKQNKFLYKNQCEEIDKQDLLQWLQTRINWSEQQKQKYYYERYTEKPQSWIKKQERIQKDKSQKQKKVQNLNQNKQITKQQINISQPKKDQQSLQQIKQTLRKQLKQKKIKRKQNPII